MLLTLSPWFWRHVWLFPKVWQYIAFPYRNCIFLLDEQRPYVCYLCLEIDCSLYVSFWHFHQDLVSEVWSKLLIDVKRHHTVFAICRKNARIVRSYSPELITYRRDLLFEASQKLNLTRTRFHCWFVEILHQLGCFSNPLKNRKNKQTYQLVSRISEPSTVKRCSVTNECLYPIPDKRYVIIYYQHQDKTTRANCTTAYRYSATFCMNATQMIFFLLLFVSRHPTFWGVKTQRRVASLGIEHFCWMIGWLHHHIDDPPEN